MCIVSTFDADFFGYEFHEMVKKIRNFRSQVSTYSY